MRLRVATYNIHSGLGNDRACDPGRIAGVLEEIGADVVGLQEVSARPELAPEPDQFRFLEARCGMTAIAGPTVVLHQARYGNVLLTRLPVLGTRLVDLSVGPYEPRGAVVADLDAGGQRLRVIVTHLGLRVWERARQHGTLADIVAARREAPVVLLGDFNSWWPDLRSLRALGPRLTARRAPASFPAHLPMLALDRVHAVPDIIVGRVRAHVTPLSRQASDHLPVVAEIDMARAVARGSGVDEEAARGRPCVEA